MKMNFAKYLNKDTVLILSGKNKFEVLDELITVASTNSKVDRDIIFRATWKREKMMTTGVGFGLALPHVRLNSIPDPVIVVGVTNEPIADYESHDDEPVRVLVFIVAPDRNQQEYLQLLGSISRKLRNTEVVKKIIEGVPSTEKILEILKNCDDDSAE
ncbi:MAG: PTS sugar transporter subunit IIA [Victivallaceae bacterium]